MYSTHYRYVCFSLRLVLWSKITLLIQCESLHRLIYYCVRFLHDRHCDTALRDLSNFLHAVCGRFRCQDLWGQSVRLVDSHRTSRHTILVHFRAYRRDPSCSVRLQFQQQRFSFYTLLDRCCCMDSCHRS